MTATNVDQDWPTKESTDSEPTSRTRPPWA
ncbi:hypothetical protein N802_05705 [Knoellia sinensis KCTC 19936]|uniref:Uncharacterized protein n=1 Tax=Knoellia sinensis KCTC 19936 TaxID=1385520 RepID=A0A0A0J5J5_9MICO|nr:hypothetical protein N802_05705 [Knoellia sinensis KCTC 19936]